MSILNPLNTQRSRIHQPHINTIHCLSLYRFIKQFCHTSGRLTGAPRLPPSILENKRVVVINLGIVPALVIILNANDDDKIYRSVMQTQTFNTCIMLSLCRQQRSNVHSTLDCTNKIMYTWMQKHEKKLKSIEINAKNGRARFCPEGFTQIYRG